MSFKSAAALAASLALLATGCAQQTAVDTSKAAPEAFDTEYMKVRNSRSDAVYINPDYAEDGSSFREVYIAAADVSDVKIIQPEGAKRDDQWDFDANEAENVQTALQEELSATLGFESAFNIVSTAEEADMIIHTTIVAIHPYATRSEAESGKASGGAVTASMALVNAATGKVMIRSVDTKSTDNIWLFHNIENPDPAINLIFRSWGNSMRRGLLHVQGRTNDPAAQAVQLKERS